MLERRQDISYAPYRKECIALRATCRAFHSLQTLSAAVFYDFNIFATPRSFIHLKALSQHPVLRKYIHRFVFYRPPLREQLTERREHDEMVPLGTTSKQKRAGLRAYQAAFLAQEMVVTHLDYPSQVGELISRFPRLSSVFISDVPLLARRLQYRGTHAYLQAEPTESADYHIALVLRALAIGQVRLKELVTYNGLGPSWKYSCVCLPGWLDVLDLSHLHRLDLFLRDGEIVSGGPDWSSTLCPGKVEVDSKDKYGRTPLSLAAEAGHEAVVRLLRTFQVS